ncbi:MAG: group 1 truncated hemoglobin [Bdellovibrionales bacterium]|nr:group 1 truncated hemoglobin [Bdellovibrionales bacterium]
MKIYDQLEDPNVVRRVNEIFYEKVYNHPWISQFFVDVKKEFITQQQTDFIIQAIGGPAKYSGRLPFNAHPHMLITEELYDLSTQLLTESLEEANAPQVLVDEWLRTDQSFRRVIVKKSISDCEKRFNTDHILAFPNPIKKAS